MKIVDFPKVYREALAYWLAFRNLGFEAAEIFFGFGVVNGHADCIYLQIRTQGKTFTATVGVDPEAIEAEVHETWKLAAQAMNESSESERETCFREHRLGVDLGYYGELVVAISRKGIIAPELAPYMGAKA